MAHDSRNELPDSSDEVPLVSLTNGPWNEGYERDETYYCQDLVLLVSRHAMSLRLRIRPKIGFGLAPGRELPVPRAAAHL